MEVVIGGESLMHLALVVVAAVVAVVVATLGEIETGTGTGTEISIETIEFLLQGGMNLLHLEVEMKAGVIVVEGVVEVIGVRVRGAVRGPHREEETVMIDSFLTFCPLLLMYGVLSFPQAGHDILCEDIILDLFFLTWSISPCLMSRHRPAVALHNPQADNLKISPQLIIIAS